MKKLISITLLICILFTTCNAFSAGVPSPTMKSLIHFNPHIEFDFLEQRLTNLDLEYWEPYKILKAYLFDMPWEKYFALDEALILYLDQKYETVEMTCRIPYDTDDLVYGVFIAEEEIVFVLGSITAEGNVIFDFSDLLPEPTVCYILSDHLIH